MAGWCNAFGRGDHDVQCVDWVKLTQICMLDISALLSVQVLYLVMLPLVQDRDVAIPFFSVLEYGY